MERALLTAFLDSDHHFQIATLIAPSGAGKTRLVSEWMRPLIANKLDSRWDAGFVVSRDSSHWESWTPTRNTLIIIDYTYNYGRVLQAIVSRFKDHTPFNIRLLILDHIQSNKLHRDFFWQHAFNEQGVIDKYKKLFFEPFPIVLKPESDESELMRAIIAAAADPYTADKRYDQKSEIVNRATNALMAIGGFIDKLPTEDQIRQRDSVRHPLFAALVGQTIFGSPEADFTSWTRRDLITHYFERGRRIPWDIEDIRNEFSESLGPWVGCYVSAATLFREVDTRDMHKCLPDLVRQNLSKNDLLRRLVQLCNRIVGSDNEHIIKAFEPDILGETFFLKFVERFESNEAVFGSFIKMLSYFKLERQERDYAYVFIKSMKRLVRNLINDDQSIKDVRDAWYWLRAFLEPNRFPKDSFIRTAISIILVDVTEKMSVQSSDAKFGMFLESISYDDLLIDCKKSFSGDVMASIIKVYEWYLPYDSNRVTIASGITDIVYSFKGDAKACWNAVRLAAEADSISAFEIIRRALGEDFRVDSEAAGLVVRKLCEKGNPDLIQGLIDMGARIHRLGFEDYELPIYIACRHGNLDIAKVLFKNGAHLFPVDYVYYFNFSPLMLACIGRYKDLIKWLIDNGASVEQYRFCDHFTSLMVACFVGDIDIVRLLLERGADPNRSMKYNGQTALMWTCTYGDFEIAKLLLANGANPFTRNSEDKDAASFARSKGHNELAEFLENLQDG